MLHPESTDIDRREFLKAGGGLLATFMLIGLLPQAEAATLDRSVFDAKTMDEALSGLGVLVPETSSLLVLTAPDVAENGALVPVTVETSLLAVEQISILADKNPTMLVANLTFPAGTHPYLSTRIRMAQTSNVVVLVKAGGKFYRASKEVKVTAGGC